MTPRGVLEWQHEKRKESGGGIPAGLFSWKGGNGLARQIPGGEKNFANLPPERLREISAKGARAAAAARRRRKGLREALLRLMEEDGVQERLAEALIREATEGSRPGSAVRAFEVIRDTIGEKPRKDGGPARMPETIDLSALSLEELLELLH